MDASGTRLRAEAQGRIEPVDGVLVIQRIDVTYHLEALEEKRDMIERVRAMHADHCPVARTLRGCVDIHTRVELHPPA